MSKIKICGLKRQEDITYVNEAGADYAGFIINVPKSHRNVTAKEAKVLRQGLSEEITAVGVFVNQDPLEIAEIANAGIIDMIQLHGTEPENYIKTLRELTETPVIKAFVIRSVQDVKLAEQSSADYVLLDSGSGSGELFDWTLLAGIKRPYFLAGGLTPENITEAINICHPFALDISSGVEIEKRKNKKKIRDAVRAAHKEEIEHE